MRRLLKKLLQVLAVVAAVGALALGLFFASLWFENSQSLELPRPTGPFAVGRVGTTWVDTGRAYPFTPPPDRDRELVVWIWYPAQRSDAAPTAEYLAGPWRRAIAEIRGVALTHFIFRSLAKVRGHSVEPSLQQLLVFDSRFLAGTHIF